MVYDTTFSYQTCQMVALALCPVQVKLSLEPLLSYLESKKRKLKMNIELLTVSKAYVNKLINYCKYVNPTCMLFVPNGPNQLTINLLKNKIAQLTQTIVELRSYNLSISC